MPRLWTDTLDTHRRQVRDAILDATAALVADRGLRSVTMSEIAETTGIGRATLYKYFRDVDAILFAWHERQVTGHLDQLAGIRDRPDPPGVRLQAMLEAYAFISREANGHRSTELAAFLHAGEPVRRARGQLQELIRGLIAEGAETGDVRRDVAPDELATYCLHAVMAATSLPSAAAVRRLVMVTVTALRPPGEPS